MSDEPKQNEKPVTLADYIPPAPPPTAKSRKAARDSLSPEDRARLEQLERAVRETAPDAVGRSGTRKSSKRKRSRANQPRKAKKKDVRPLVFWAIIIMLIIAFVND